MKNIFIYMFLFIAVTNLWADQLVTTNDGQKIILHDDKTWEYQTSNKSTDSQKSLTPSENAFDEWADLRTNGDSEKGKIVTWRIKIAYGYLWNTDKEFDFEGGPGAFLNSDGRYEIILYGTGSKKLKVDDIVVVRAEFIGINTDGKVVLKILKYRKISIEN